MTEESRTPHSIVVTVVEDGPGGLNIYATSEPTSIADSRLRLELASIMVALGVTVETMTASIPSQELN